MIDFAQIQGRFPLKAFVNSLGVELTADGNGWRAPCPLHNEKRGQSFRIDPDEIHWVCFGKCQNSDHPGGDVIDLACVVWNCDTVTACRKLLDGDAIPVTGGASLNVAPVTRQRKWPPRDLEAIDTIVRSGFGLYDLWESSPLRFEDGESHTEQIIDVILPGDPWLCIGETNDVFWTRRRSEWRGELSRYPLMVPSPMLSKIGRTGKGKLSEHSLEATADRVYLAIEFDFTIYETNGVTETEFAPLIREWSAQKISVADACAALHWHLAGIPAGLPFVMAVHSGGKSVHAWFRAYPLYDEATWPFMRYAHQLGADHVTWTRSQFVRIPDGRRQDGSSQATFYFNPGKAVIHNGT